MTCMAYRDGVLAADRQITHNSLVFETDGKILIINEKTVMAFSGAYSISEYFRQWYEEGAVREDWLFSKEIPDRCCFVVLVMQVINDFKKELALGAMYAGADAVDSVFAANNHLDDCGFGVCAVDGNESELIVRRK